MTPFVAAVLAAALGALPPLLSIPRGEGIPSDVSPDPRPPVKPK